MTRFLAASVPYINYSYVCVLLLTNFDLIHLKLYVLQKSVVCVYWHLNWCVTWASCLIVSLILNEWDWRWESMSKENWVIIQEYECVIWEKWKMVWDYLLTVTEHVTEYIKGVCQSNLPTNTTCSHIYIHLQCLFLVATSIFSLLLQPMFFIKYCDHGHLQVSKPL